MKGKWKNKSNIISAWKTEIRMLVWQKKSSALLFCCWQVMNFKLIYYFCLITIHISKGFNDKNGLRRMLPHHLYHLICNDVIIILKNINQIMFISSCHVNTIKIMTLLLSYFVCLQSLACFPRWCGPDLVPDKFLSESSSMVIDWSDLDPSN